MLQSYGLVKVSFTSVNNSINFVSIQSSLPYNTYVLRFGDKFDVLYVPNTPYIYKVGKCLNHTLLDSTGQCVEYTCSTLNCLFCYISATVCSVCKSGFTRNDLYQCVSNNISQNTT